MQIITNFTDQHKGIRVVKREKGRPILEVVKWIFHSRKTLSSGAGSGTQQVAFFRSEANTNALKTNLRTDGQLSKPNELFLFGVSVHVPNNSGIDDVENLYNFGVIKLKVSGKDYLDTPLHMIPACGGLTGYGYADGASSPVTKNMIHNGGSLTDRPYDLRAGGKPVHIIDQESFETYIDVIGGAVFNADLDITYCLHGLLARPTV